MATKVIISKGKKLTAEEREKYEAARRKWLKRLKPLADKIDAAQRITEKDLAVYVNT